MGGAADATPTDDLLAIRLQRWVPWVLPLPDQAVVREQARLVLPAHGPWLPDHAPALIRQDDMLTSEQMWRTHRWQEHAVLARLPHLLVRTPTLHGLARWMRGSAPTIARHSVR